MFGTMADVPDLPYASNLATSNWAVNDDIVAIGLNGERINPLEIRDVFTPGTWVVAQLVPAL